MSNLGFNILAMPITLVWIFVPVALPASVFVSTSILKLSPDRLFAYMVAVEAETGRVIYQNDYYANWVPEGPSGYSSLAAALLEEFRRE